MSVRERVRAWWATPWAPYAVSFAVQLLVAPWLVHDWDGFVFLRATEQFLAGLTPYQVASEAPSYIYLAADWPAPNSWYAYPPLALLLFTPFVALAHALGATDPWMLRIALKLPMVFGTLALAWVVGFAVRELGGETRMRRRAERFVLLNPFLLLVAAAWGMFDAWMMALLLLAAVLLARKRPVLAGVAFGAATLVKIFPLFVAPAFVIVALRLLTPRDAGRFVAVAAGVFALVSLPFFLTSPGGFWQQVVGMHLERPPQGFPAMNALYFPRFSAAYLGFEPWPLPPGWLGPALSTALLVPALLVVYAYAASGTPDLRHLLRATFAGLFAFLLLGKVVNEQYFVMPIAVLAILAHAPHAMTRTRTTAWAWTWGGLVAATLVGFHFLTFLPRDVAPVLLGMTAAEAVHALGVSAAVAGIPPATFHVLPDVVSTLALIPPFVLSGLLLLRPAKEAWAHLRAERAADMAPLRRSVATVALALMLVGPTAFGATATYHATRPDLDPMPPLPEGRVLGATYYLWWNNPSRDPDVLDGNWAQGAHKPPQGYYTTNGHQMALDVDAMLAAGVSFAVVSYHGYDDARYQVFAKVARAKGLYFAPMVEATELLGRVEHRNVLPDGSITNELRPDDATRQAYQDLVERALRVAGSDAFLHIDGKPVVFLNDAHLVNASWDDASRRAVASQVYVAHNDSLDEIGRAWNVTLSSFDDLVAMHPSSMEAFRADGPEAAAWRDALLARRGYFVDGARNASAEKLFLVGPYVDDAEWFDGSFNLGPQPAFVRPAAGIDSWAEWERRQREAAARYGEWAFAAVQNGYDDSLRRPDAPTITTAAEARRTWDAADALGARWRVFHSWNQWFEGAVAAPFG